MSREYLKTFKPVVIRVLIYAVFITAAVALIPLEARYNYSADLFSEDSWIEQCQLVFLFLSMVFIVWSGKRRPEAGAMTTLMAGMIVVAMFRECDAVLDLDMFEGAWKAGAAVTILVTLALVWRKRGELIPAISKMMTRPSFGYFVCAFLTIFIFSRLFGMNELWFETMGKKHFIRAVKNGVEEGSELFGYALMVIASVELFVESFSTRGE